MKSLALHKVKAGAHSMSKKITLLTLGLIFVCSSSQLQASGKKIPMSLNWPQAKDSDVHKIFSKIKSFYAQNPSYASTEMIDDCRDLMVTYYPAENKNDSSDVYFRRLKKSPNGTAVVKLKLFKDENLNDSDKSELKRSYYLSKNLEEKKDLLIFVSNRWEENRWTKKTVPVSSSYTLIQVEQSGEISGIRKGTNNAYYRKNHKAASAFIAAPLAVAASSPPGLIFIGKKIIESTPFKCGKIKIPETKANLSDD